MPKISPHFSFEEFECHNGDEVPPNLESNLVTLVCDVLEPIRNMSGLPLTVISGYRSPAYNRRIGGALDSAHMTAEAADIRPGRGYGAADLHADILEMVARGRLPALGGLGLYKTWVHVDTRKAKDGHLRRWRGHGVGSEQ